ncbi:MAG: hypothetical protein RDV48_23885 [Candidatus Eremiobacteraeota bacterium]|nr:hypothetical protein [Candidatus Eremiobacteraeota bacterium]
MLQLIASGKTVKEVAEITCYAIKEELVV